MDWERLDEICEIYVDCCNVIIEYFEDGEVVKNLLFIAAHYLLEPRIVCLAIVIHRVLHAGTLPMP